jgi:hypothetical protein
MRKEVDIIWLVQNRVNIVRLFTAGFYISIVSTKCKFLYWGNRFRLLKSPVTLIDVSGSVKTSILGKLTLATK